MAIAPTAEQLHIHDQYRTGKPLLVRAGAGTGKTTTVIQLADIVRSEGKLGLYVAFNKSIATEAGRKMPGCIRASTAHSLAYQGIANTRHAPLLARMRDTRRIPFFETARQLDIRGLSVRTATGNKFLDDRRIARHALATVDRFCKSADRTLTAYHVPPMPGLDLDGERSNNAMLTDWVLPAAQRVWANIQDPDGTGVRFDHGHYLKLWALENPVLGQDGNSLFLDEAQDTSPVLAGVIGAQTHLRRVYVGDSAQSIYGFTGAVNAMNSFPGSVEGRLTQSWRFGETIAEGANDLLDELGDDLRLTGNPGRASVIDEQAERHDAILCRTNGGALAEVLTLQGSGRRVHLMADNAYALRFLDAADALKHGEPVHLADLAAFSSWADVVEYAEEATDAADWKTLVALIDKHGTDRLRAALGGVVDERAADVLVVTAHKAKGREWGRVRLSCDLSAHLGKARERADEAHRSGDPDVLRKARRSLSDELMLCYVAVTRAQDVLSPGGVLDVPVLFGGVQ